METSWLSGLLGGLLIGTGAALLLLGNGRIAGASGILREVLALRFDDVGRERLAFLVALVVVPLMIASQTGAPMLEAPVPVPAMAVGGLLVGIGVTWANGCTSGHGVCGLARFSRRSLVATATFMATTALTLFVVRHVVGA